MASATLRETVPLLVFVLSLVASARAAEPLRPENILVVANRNFDGSEALARYYMERRAVPEANLFLMDLPTVEDVNRVVFNEKIAEPLRDELARRGAGIRCLVTIRGVPLNIWDPFIIQDEIAKLKSDLAATKAATPPGDTGPIEAAIAKKEAEAKELANSAASVDSELALLNFEHKLPGRVPSPFIRAADWPEGCYQVSRLDATTDADVRSMIDGGLDAEGRGLKGTVYVDARGLKRQDAYSLADGAMRRAAELAKSKGFDVVLDERDTLFAVDSCSNAAIYWGWYSLAKYVDCCRFVPGAIAVHVASGECNSLREGEYWCRHLIRRGAAVTMGPTNEPYLDAFPVADEFLGRIFDGASVAEAYYATQPWLSWRMVLLGDPLYRPFHSETTAKEEEKPN